MEAIVLLGAPGSGKGTVAEDIKSSVHYEHVSTGDVLRAAIAAGRPVGKEAEAYMERGELVPDDVIIRIIKDLIESNGNDACYMFDGFPRTTAQAEQFDELLKVYSSALKHVFLLEVQRDILVKRICGRRICRSCGAVYNVHTKRPKVDGVCDFCGSRDIYQRDDDTEETLNNRLDVYERQTAELIDYYNQKKLLVRVDAVDRRETERTILDYLEQGK